MSKKLLIITPSKSFGELVTSNLDQDEFNTVICLNTGDALTLDQLDLAIIDVDFEDMEPGALLEALSAKSPGLKTIIIHSPDQPINLNPAEEGQVILLPRPSDLPELLKSIGEITNQRIYPGSSPQDHIEDKPEQGLSENWLSEYNTIQERLKKSIFTPLIREAFLLSPENILGSTMELDQGTEEFLIDTIFKKIGQSKEYDLVRFLQIGDDEHLLLAKSFGEIGILAVLFDPNTKFSTANSIVNALSARIISAAKEKENDYFQFIQQPENIGSGPEEMESENPSSPYGEWIPETPFYPDTPTDTDEPEIVFPWNTDIDNDIETGTDALPETENQETLQEEVNQQWMEDSPNQESSKESDAEDSPESDQQSDNQKADLDVDTRPVKKSMDTNQDWGSMASADVDPAPEDMVPYTFLLISNYPGYPLENEFGRIVENEIHSVCQEKGWVQLLLDIHKDYLQLTIEVPKTIPPDLISKHLRQRTTRVLMEALSDIEKEIIEGDFWAPAQLITAGKKPENP